MEMPHVESRDADVAKMRAVVVEMSTARWFIGIAVTVLMILCGIVWRASAYGSRIESLEASRLSRNSEMSDLRSNIARIDDRIRPLEITSVSTANSLSYMRDTMVKMDAKIDKLIDQDHDK